MGAEENEARRKWLVQTGVKCGSRVILLDDCKAFRLALCDAVQASNASLARYVGQEFIVTDPEEMSGKSGAAVILCRPVRRQTDDPNQSTSRLIPFWALAVVKTEE